MSRIDIVIAIILGMGAFLGYKRGFLMELFFLCAIVLGVLIGFRLMGAGVTYLHEEFSADTTLLPYISFFIIFVLVVIGVTLIGRSIKAIVDKTFLGRVDALAGALLSAMKYMFCLSVLLWLLSALHYSFPENWTRDSWLYPFTAAFAPKVASFFSGILPLFSGIFKQF